MNKQNIFHIFIGLMFVETIDVMQPYYCNSLFNKPFLQVRQKIHPILKNRKIHCRIIALRIHFSPKWIHNIENQNGLLRKFVIIKGLLFIFISNNCNYTWCMLIVIIIFTLCLEIHKQIIWALLSLFIFRLRHFPSIG